MVLIVVAAVFFTLPAAPAQAAPPILPGTNGPDIWAGYVKEWTGASPYSGYYAIHAEWTVPKVACPPRPGVAARQYRIGIWVGLGGWNGKYPFAQTGVAVYCPVEGGPAEYRAWREYISGVYNPKPPEELELAWATDTWPVRPGNRIVADVVYQHGRSLVRLDNPGNWPKAAEETRIVPRYVLAHTGPIFRFLPVRTTGVSAEAVVEPGQAAPVFDHVTFQNTQAAAAAFGGFLGLFQPRTHPFRSFTPDPVGSYSATTGQTFYPTEFIDDNFAVFQTVGPNPFRGQP